MLVRTHRGAKKQQGITFLLLDRMDYPGMEVRPIVGLDGLPEQGEVFFDNVRVPQAGRIGAENDGWSVAKALLKFERGGAAYSPSMRRKLALIRDAATILSDGRALMDDHVFERDLGELEAEIASYEHFEKLAISGHAIGHDPAAPSLDKVMSSELAQRVSNMMTRVSGIGALPLQLEALEVGSGVPALGTTFGLSAIPY